MNNSLDISIHGPQRVAIVEQLVHICRYSPGLVLLEGDAGKSPVNFLRDMADLLRDELDFALLDNTHCEVPVIAAELVSQWYIYQMAEHEQTDTQSVHHYLDLGLQSGRLALIVVERTSLLADDAINFLVGMMARHSRLTILFSGIVDARPLLRRAQQAEVPVHRIDMPDSADHSVLPVGQSEKTRAPPVLSASNFDHRFSDESYELPEDDALEDDLYELDSFVAETKGRREPIVTEQFAVTQPFNTSDSRLGVSTHLSAVREWGSATISGLREKKSGGFFLLLGGLIFVALLLLLVLYPRDIEVVSLEQLPVKPAVVVTAEHNVSPDAPIIPPVIVSAPEANSVVAPDKPAQPDVPVAMEQVAPAPSTPPIAVVNSGRDVMPEQVGKKPKPDEAKANIATKTILVTEKQWRAKPDNFTVQVAAAHNEANIKRLETKLPLVQPHYVYRTTRNGKPWFILIYGSYAGKQAALAARDALPSEFRKGSTPWVRKQGEVFTK